MARATRTYDHFCSLARALERVGERWTLLVVRDLLGGPRRFTDLMARLGGITPKTLSERLRDLTAAGIIAVDRVPGRREVWYRLTPAGEELAPAVAALTLWGLRHASRPPFPGEAVHPEHMLKAVRLVLEQSPSPPRPLTWQFQFADDDEYALRFDGQQWLLEGELISDDPEVVVRTTTGAWVDYLTTPAGARPAAPPGIELIGADDAVRRFTELLSRFPDGAEYEREPRPSSPSGRSRP
jgi:DNA-binding HxlR family transcriptional regulator